ncbi:UNVERIFIED_CONTAM: hypothetical protein GTU68_004706 [Idotea baltica]|nr:hypothetical protein [Idotea baltica]
MKIGVLALQGAFAKHISAIRQLGAETHEIRRAEDFANISALILPGGESTTMLRLLDSPLSDQIKLHCEKKKPVLATCAGVIILAKEVSSPKQHSFGILDIHIERNGYGRQADSFIASNIKLRGSLFKKAQDTEGVFIRAPKISSIGDSVEVIAKHNDTVVAVRQDNLLATTFHPELSKQSPFHEALLTLC